LRILQEVLHDLLSPAVAALDALDTVDVAGTPPRVVTAVAAHDASSPLEGVQDTLS
jgi:hypothetical protein